jgi:hypothetical protein
MFANTEKETTHRTVQRSRGKVGFIGDFGPI